jgi:cytochrome c oxidase subunit 4
MAHPTTKQYIRIAALLAVLTGVEVGLYYLEAGVDAVTTSMTSPALLVLAAVKFLVVVGWFMHVKFEKPLVSRFFAIGFVIAIGVYAVVLTEMAVAFARG